ncbi:BglG family transcription antiterminator [Anaerococcus lactolyticus]|uniref:Transcriptional regulator n=2 Tax=Anaerococcus lactolyticus TaxID=33032 RepID=A0A095YEX7_9FIRM|nr:BglG family transcription antiterminator [Anaerococcus lactolyticus]EEI86055.1 putative licABCH operon regulator [Anaerococcus lactolyticus ATCC 51172]KGF05127.1 transcriptional regulator [Anaerococcus lactolyticus S7-1-13]
MIETRLKQIFDYLTLDYDYHTSKEIGEVMELSSKTIRKEINLLNSVIKDKGAIIESKPSKGFIFTIKDKDKFKIFLKNDWYKYAYYQEEDGDKNLRYVNILRTFLFSNSYIKQFELAETFHVSESQINKDLPNIRQILEGYDLELVSKPYYGMKVEGNEKDIRLAIKNEIGEDPLLFEGDKDRDLFDKIQEVIEKIDFGDDYYMPYVNFKNLVIHIYISVLRIKQGKYINLADEFKNKIKSYKEYQLAKNIVDKLELKLGIKIPNQELGYITMHLVAKNTIRDQKNISSEILKLSQAIIDEIYKVSKYDFRANIDFFFALAIHLGPLVNRIRYGFNMKNPILDDIKENKISYLLATIGASVVNEKYKTKLSEDEIGYIALHIMAAINSNTINTKNILIICGAGNSSAQIMKTQLNRQFGNNIKEIRTTDLRSLDQINMNDYDLIISSVKLGNDFDLPIVYVDIIFSKVDLDNIKIALDDTRLGKIYDIFANSVLVRTSKFTNKLEILKFIAETIEDKSNFEKETALNQLKKREEMGQTSFDTIAIPHILDQVKGDSYSIIIILDKPIKWNDNKVDLVYSLIVGDRLGDMSLYYEKLGEFLSNKPIQKEALKTKDPMEFMNVFMKGGING